MAANGCFAASHDTMLEKTARARRRDFFQTSKTLMKSSWLSTGAPGVDPSRMPGWRPKVCRRRNKT